MENTPPLAAVLQFDGSFMCWLTDGSSVRYSQRMDGTWRRPERRKAGWIGDLEIPRYQPPQRRLSTLSLEKQLRLSHALAAHIAVSLKSSKDTFLASSTVSFRIWSFLGPVLEEKIASHMDVMSKQSPVINTEARFRSSHLGVGNTPLPAAASSKVSNELYDSKRSAMTFFGAFEHGRKLFLTCFLRSASNDEVDLPCTLNVNARSIDELQGTSKDVHEHLFDKTKDPVVPPAFCELFTAKDDSGMLHKPPTRSRTKSEVEEHRLQLCRIPHAGG